MYFRRKRGIISVKRRESAFPRETLKKQGERNQMSDKTITKDTLVSEIPEINPAAVDVLWNLGMGCIHCIMANQETVEEAASVHGLDMDELLKALNEAK